MTARDDEFKGIKELGAGATATIEEESAGAWPHAKTASLINNRVRLLITVGAAVALDSQKSLQGAISELQNTGVSEKDIKDAMEIGRFVRAYNELSDFAVEHVSTLRSSPGEGEPDWDKREEAVDLVEASPDQRTVVDRCDTGGAEFRRAVGEVPGIIDHKLALMAVAGAAVATDCDPCLDKVAPELEQAGVARDDIRRAVKSGQFSSKYVEMGTQALGHICEDIFDDEQAN